MAIAHALPGLETALCDTPLGRLLLVASESGVRHLDLDASADTLWHRFERAFPATPRRALQSAVGRRALHAIESYFDGDATELDAPLDATGTPFQQRVWQALREIPRGHTRSYGEVARRIGQPTASRAVAQACGANPIPLFTPCHRVIAGDGSLGGFALGVERKRELLALEGAL